MTVSTLSCLKILQKLKRFKCFCLHFHRFIRKVYPQISSIFYMNLAQCYQIMRFFKKLGINFLTKRGPKYLVTFWLFWILSLQSKIAACIYLIPLYKDLGYPFPTSGHRLFLSVIRFYSQLYAKGSVRVGKKISSWSLML